MTQKEKPNKTLLQLQEGLDSLTVETRRKILIQSTDKAKVKLVRRRLLKDTP